MAVRRYANRAAALFTAVACSSCLNLPAGQHEPHTSPEKPLGRNGCGPPITYQVFQQDAFGAAWSKVTDRIAFNAKGSDGRYHVFTAEPNGTGGRQLGLGSASFPQRTTGSPVWSPSGRFIAFVAEKSVHPGNSVGATPGWGSYSDLWVATADGSQAWQLTDVAADVDHGTIIPEFSPAACWSGRSAPPPARSSTRIVSPGTG